MVIKTENRTPHETAPMHSVLYVVLDKITVSHESTYQYISKIYSLTHCTMHNNITHTMTTDK